MIKEKTVQYAKELDDVLELLFELIKAIKNKDGYTSLLDDLIKAVNGMDEIDEEMENHLAVVNTVSPQVYKIVMLFVKGSK